MVVLPDRYLLLTTLLHELVYATKNIHLDEDTPLNTFQHQEKEKLKTNTSLEKPTTRRLDSSSSRRWHLSLFHGPSAKKCNGWLWVSHPMLLETSGLPSPDLSRYPFRAGLTD